ADLGPGEPRHHDVEDDDVELAAASRVERLLAVGRRLDLEALGPQRVAHRREDVRLVVREEDTRAHRCTAVARSPTNLPDEHKLEGPKPPQTRQGVTRPAPRRR